MINDDESQAELSYDWDDIAVRAGKTIGQTFIAANGVIFLTNTFMSGQVDYTVLKSIIVPVTAGFVSFAWNTFTGWVAYRKKKKQLGGTANGI